MLLKVRIKGTEEVGYLAGYSSGANGECDWCELLVAFPSSGKFRTVSIHQAEFVGIGR